MARPMLRMPQQKTEQKTNTMLRADRKQDQRKQQLTTEQQKMQLNRILRKKRSKEYMEVMQQLDAGGHVHNQHKIDEMLNVIRSEFPEVELSGILIGYVAICYLGAPYEVHTLDMTGKIIQHFKRGEALPNGMEKARGIAMHGGYAFIEVYTDCCRAVSPSGNVSVI